MKYLILAGGFATRLWPLSEGRAKPLLLLDGKTILAHILSKIPEGSEIVILTNKRFEDDFQKEMKKLSWENYEIFPEDSFSEGEKLGALGAISAAVDHYGIKDSIMVLAGDNLLPEVDFDKLVVSKNQASLVVYDVKDLHTAQKFGVVELGEQISKNVTRVKGFEEKPSKPKATTVSTAFVFVGGDLLPLLKAYSEKKPDDLGGCFVAFIEAGKEVLAISVEGEWFDVGSFETYLEAHKKIQQKTTSKGQNVEESNNQLSGKVFLGDEVVLTNSVVRDSIIYPGCRIENCQLSSCVISENVSLRDVDLNNKIIRKGVNLSGSEG